MVSETKAASDTRLHQCESASSLLPLNVILSVNSDKTRQYRSGNNISSRERLPKSSIKSINDNYQRSLNNHLINTHFPIAYIPRDSTLISKTSSSQLPTVPKQAGTFIHRLVNKFFSITNTNQKKNNLSRIKRKQINTTLNTRIISDDSHTLVNIPSKKQRRQRLKTIRNNNKHCVVCRRYRNCFSILPTDSLEYPSQPSMSLPKTQFEKIRTLNESQYQTIASAVELIFDTLISNYQQT